VGDRHRGNPNSSPLPPSKKISHAPVPSFFFQPTKIASAKTLRQVKSFPFFFSPGKAPRDLPLLFFSSLVNRPSHRLNTRVQKQEQHLHFPSPHNAQFETVENPPPFFLGMRICYDRISSADSTIAPPAPPLFLSSGYHPLPNSIFFFPSSSNMEGKHCSRALPSSSPLLE